VAAAAAPRTLDSYQIDVEGGKTMLVVSPSRESMLVDAGWPPRYAPGGRDVEQIRAAMEDAGLRRIDNLLITHLDIDHLGDLAALTGRIEVGRIIDNGALQSVGKGREQTYGAYAKLRARYPHLVPAPGDRLRLRAVDVGVLAAVDHEDNMWIGLLHRFGLFRLVDPADLEWAYEMRLMCPRHPPVTANNRARKGSDLAALEIIRRSPGLEDVWQLHASLAGGALNAQRGFIASIEEKCAAKWIKLSVRADGPFTITNGRNGFRKEYRVHWCA